MSPTRDFVGKSPTSARVGWKGAIRYICMVWSGGIVWKEGRAWRGSNLSWYIERDIEAREGMRVRKRLEASARAENSNSL